MSKSKRILSLVLAMLMVVSMLMSSLPAVFAVSVDDTDNVYDAGSNGTGVVTMDDGDTLDPVQQLESSRETSESNDASVNEQGLDLHFYKTDAVASKTHTISTLDAEDYPAVGIQSGSTTVVNQLPSVDLFHSVDVGLAGQTLDWVWKPGQGTSASAFFGADACVDLALDTTRNYEFKSIVFKYECKKDEELESERLYLLTLYREKKDEQCGEQVKYVITALNDGVSANDLDQFVGKFTDTEVEVVESNLEAVEVDESPVAESGTTIASGTLDQNFRTDVNLNLVSTGSSVQNAANPDETSNEPATTVDEVDTSDSSAEIKSSTDLEPFGQSGNTDNETDVEPVGNGGQDKSEQSNGDESQQEEPADESSVEDLQPAPVDRGEPSHETQEPDDADASTNGTDEENDEQEVHNNLIPVDEDKDEPLLDESELTKSTLKSSKKAVKNRLTRGGDQVPEQEPVVVDGTTIEKLTVRWLTKSTGEDSAARFGRLTLQPNTDSVEDQQFQVDFSVFGERDYEPGEMELVFPAYIWTGRTGSEVGELNLSVPADPENRAEFSYRRVNSSIIITNTKRISASNQTFIQGSFRNVDPTSIVADSVSTAIVPTLSVVTKNGQVASMTGNSIDAIMETAPVVKKVTKSAFNATTSEYDIFWNGAPSGMPSDFAPENPNDYMYIRWYVVGVADGSQPFEMQLRDSAIDEYGCKVLGVSSSFGNTKSEGGESVSGAIYSGYTQKQKSAYVWTAYDKSQFTGGETVTISNTATIAAVGLDNGAESTASATATAQVTTPIQYTYNAHWDDNDNAKGRRPSSITLTIEKLNYNFSEEDGHIISSYYNTWKRVPLNPRNNWSYAWNDNGKGTTYRVYVYELPSQEVAAGHYTIDNTYVYYGWAYYSKSRQYKSETHTWDETFKYYESMKETVPVGTGKSVEYKYDDSYERSTRDTALNSLSQNKPVSVSYSMDSGIALERVTGADPDSRKTVTAVLEDERYTLNGEDVTTDDVEIDSVVMSHPQITHLTPTGKPDAYSRSDVSDYGTLKLYGYNGTDWIQMASLTRADTTATVEVGTGATASGTTVTMPSGISKVKVALDTSESYVYLSCTVRLKVKPSDAVQTMLANAYEVSDYAMFRLYNQMRAYYINDEEDCRVQYRADTGFLHGRQFKVQAYMTKQFKYKDNDSVEQRLKFRSTLNLVQQSNVLSYNDYVNSVKDGFLPCSKSGTFYDLLPTGVVPDLDSIAIEYGDKLIDAYTQENYNGSGRTLVIIKVRWGSNYKYDTSQLNTSVTGYRSEHTISFDSYYPWDLALYEDLTLLRNTAAYESDERVIGTMHGYKGEPDNPAAGNNLTTSAAVGNDWVIFRNMDKSRNDEAFVYAGSNLDSALIDLMGMSSIQKHVLINGSGRWTSGIDNDAIVQTGSGYSYRLFVRANADTKMENLFIVDSIENANVDGYQWHGRLKSIDVSNLRAMDIEPVVHYSTVPNLDIDWLRQSSGSNNIVIERDCTKNHLLNDELNGEKIWTTTAPDDLSTVTAIAIDASKKPDGSNFVLQENEFIAAYLYMQAPSGSELEGLISGNGDNANENAHAYNTVSLNYTFKNGADDITSGTELQTPTKVGLISKRIYVYHNWDDYNNNDGMRPDEVTVKLYANGQPTEETLVLNNDNNWSGVFDYLPVYNDDGTHIDYTFKSEPFAGYTTTMERYGDSVYLQSSHDLVKIDVPVAILWDDEDNAMHKRPEESYIRLYADGVLTNKSITVTQNSDGDWVGAFEQVGKYRYGNEITYEIEELPIEDYLTEYNGNEITNIFYPYGELTVSKVVNGATEAAADTEFTFTVEFNSLNGDPDPNQYEYAIRNNGSDEILSSGSLGNGDEFKLKADQRIQFPQIPTRVVYTVSEAKTPGFTSVSVTNDTGTIQAGEYYDAVFASVYSTSGAAQLEAKVELTGRTLTRNQFRFYVMDPNSWTGLRSTYNSADGSIQFGQMKYTANDDGVEFLYGIAQDSRLSPGYSYDDTVYAVYVTPHDNGDGTMTCDVRYCTVSPNEDTGEPEFIEMDHVPVFHNEYHAYGETVLRAWKVLDQRALEDDEFLFELVDEDKNVISNAHNDASGSVAFNPIGFTEEDVGHVIHYVAREVEGDDETVVYDSSRHGYSVEVFDNGDGTLSFNQSFEKPHFSDTDEQSSEPTEPGNGEGGGTDGDGADTSSVASDSDLQDNTDYPIFTNTLKPGSLSITKFVTYEDGQTPDTTRKFRFKVKLIGKDVSDGTLGSDSESNSNSNSNSGSDTGNNSGPEPGNNEGP